MASTSISFDVKHIFLSQHIKVEVKKAEHVILLLKEPLEQKIENLHGYVNCGNQHLWMRLLIRINSCLMAFLAFQIVQACLFSLNV